MFMEQVYTLENWCLYFLKEYILSIIHVSGLASNTNSNDNFTENPYT